MKSIQVKKEEKEEINNKDVFKNSMMAGIIGFVSWIFLPLIFFPLAGYYKFKETYFSEISQLLIKPNIYLQSLFVGFLFFLFFYLTLKHKEKSKSAKIIMWTGITLYALFYLGYLFLLFFFRFTDL